VVVVGLMKADRVIYLPLMGFCLLQAWICTRNKKWSWLFVMVQLFLFCAKLHERNVAWSHSLNLWMAAYKLNPKSRHTIYNCGYELSLGQRYEEAEYVLRPIADPHVEGPTNTFVYAMTLFNLQRCDEVHQLLDRAFHVLDELAEEGGVRNSPSSLTRTRSNLLVARSYCTKSIPEKGKLMYDAVEVDPTNEYAIQQAQALVTKLRELGIPFKD
jgi:hypothetical protein